MTHHRRRTISRPLLAAAAASAAAFALAQRAAQAQDVSQPVILQWFDGSYKTMERRTPDYFMAGYGGLWTPPPTRADSGNGSVGYDVYDRFDLGKPGSSTQYGTETGLKSMIASIHNATGRVYLDLIWNHNGFSDWGNVDGQGHSFLNAGGYPGFYMGPGNGQWGDFHDPSAGGDENMQLAGLIDIDQSKNNQYIRNPVAANAQNIPAGTQSAYGRLANVPDPNNIRFYPNQSNSITVNDPALGQNNVPIYNFNINNPSSGTAVAENATGYLMRNARWLIQDTGADGFRLDATKHFPNWVLNYFDHAVYKAIQSPLLDGSTQNVWSFGENLDTNFAALQSRVRLDINSQPANTVGGNRDTLDFPIYYAMQSNLSSNGLANDWRNVVNSSFDGNYIQGNATADGLANNGSQGVAFVQSHDGGGPPPYLDNVAYAYTLMRPGNAIVYFNGKEFGTRGNGFPRDGRGDALGGINGDKMTTLLNIRNSYGRGNYHERWLDKETLVFERETSLIAGYNNRLDNGYDQRTVNTLFDPGMHLIELTGNATNAIVDPNDNILDVVTVAANGQITIRIPRNKNVNGVEHDKGYVIYGPATPRGTLSVSNVAKTLAADTPTQATNGTARLTAIDVVKANTFNVKLATIPVVLPDAFHDLEADGDNANLKFDGGIDVNGNGHVDFTSPNGSAYGYENFVTKKSPLYSGGDGEYIQTVDTTQLSEGYHYITARAYRHRAVAGTPIYQDFRKVIYVDRQRPNSAVDSIQPQSNAANRDVIIKSTDQTATAVAVFYNIGASQFTLDQLADMGESSQTPANAYDRDLFKWGVNDWKNGNNSITVVTYEITYDPTQNYAGGGVNVQRFNAVGLGQGAGFGLGDTDFNGLLSPNDPQTFLPALASNGTSFNPAGDLNGDGLNDEADNVLMVPWLTFKNANAGTIFNATSNRLNRAIALDGTLAIPGGTLDVSGTPVSGVALSFSTGFNIPAGRTITKTGSQALNISGTQAHGANAVLAVAGGTANINSNGGSNLTVNATGSGAAVNFGASQTLKAVGVAAGASVTLPASGTATQYGGKILSVQSLNMTGGKLELNNNNLAINYASGGPSPIGDVTAQLAAGRNGGSWDGAAGITSAIAGTTAGVTALGVAEASDVLGLIGTATMVWSGVTVDGDSVLVKYTYGGDANLDGMIGISDYGKIDFGIGIPGATGWYNGDFNYDGKVSISDYGIIDFNAGAQGTPIVSSSAPLALSGTAAVPEPAAAGMIFVGASAALLFRRRRHRREISAGMR